MLLAAAQLVKRYVDACYAYGLRELNPKPLVILHHGREHLARAGADYVQPSIVPPRSQSLPAAIKTGAAAASAAAARLIPSEPVDHLRRMMPVAVDEGWGDCVICECDAG